MMQSSNEVAEAPAALSFGSKRNSTAAVNAFIRNVVSVVDVRERSIDFYPPDRPGNMAHVVTADHVVIIADTMRLHVAVG